MSELWALHKLPVRRKALSLDVTYYFFNSVLLSLVLAFPLSVVAWGLNKLVPAGVQSLAVGWPTSARFCAALVLGEIGGYWGHRLLHVVPVLWRFHAVHHSVEEVDWMANCRVHPLDLIFTRICGYIPLYVFGLLQPFTSAGDPAVMGFIVAATIWAFFIHANLRWRFGWLEYLLVTPAFHHWHHTRREPLDRNFATVLPWVDWIFGTMHLPRREWPAEYGISEPMPTSLGAQLIYPLRMRAAQPAPLQSHD